MNEKLIQLAKHFDSVFVHHHPSGWSASAEKRFSPAIEMKVRVHGHETPEAAVDELYRKVSEARDQIPSLS